MKKRTELSMEMHRMMLKMGYAEDLCDAISHELNTDYTAMRMIGYLLNRGKMAPQDIVDEMLAILQDRETYVQKKMMEETQAALNEFWATGFAEE